jgi:low affinity Fe/Cu permease
MANNSKSTYGSVEHARNRFSQFAQVISHATGHPIAFVLAVGVVIVWAVTGPLFDFSDTWQLVINTGTTIVTFLMVFLIQNTQNRDTLALQLKLSELVLAQKGADNSFVELENLSDAELQKVHVDLCRRAEHTLSALEHRKSKAQSKPKRNRKK